MKNKYFLFWVIILVLGMVGVWWLGSSNSFEPQETNPSTTAAHLKIGVILPLSGDYAAIGESIQKAMELSAKRTDGNIELVFEDDRGDAKTAVSAYQKLHTVDRVDTVVTVLTASYQAIKPLAMQDLPIMFQLTSESAENTKDNIFQIMPFDFDSFSTLGKEAGKRYERIAVVYGSADLMQKNKKYFSDNVPQGRIVFSEELAPGADPKTLVAKLLASNADSTTVFLLKDDGIRFLKALKEQGGSKVKVICDANIEATYADYASALGNDYLNGCISTFFAPVADSPEVEGFKTAYAEAYKEDPQFGADLGYDLVTLANNYLIGKSKNEWVQSFTGATLNGASGPIRFDENGTRPASVEVHILNNGKFEKLK